MRKKEESRRTGLARALSKLGYCSRSQAMALIRAGRVNLNGTVRRDPETPVRLEYDRIAVDGRPVASETKIYLMMNKPRGLITSAADEQGRQTVYALLDKAKAHGGEADQTALPWIAPVGRLDKASEGLLLLTNDSEWAARITDPETGLLKTYHVQIDTVVDEERVQSLARGLPHNGEILRAKSAQVLRSGEKNCWLEILLDEGRNRQIRRMLAALGVEVLRLVRVAIGPLALGDLAKGAVRPLTGAEKLSLDRAIKSKAS